MHRMAQDEKKPKTAADLLADWRAAERDTVAAGSASKVATLALEASTAAEEDAAEVEARDRFREARDKGFKKG